MILAPTLHVTGKTSIIPWRVSFQLHFIGKVILVFWKLSLEDFIDIPDENKLPQVVSLVIHNNCFTVCTTLILDTDLYFKIACSWRGGV